MVETIFNHHANCESVHFITTASSCWTSPVLITLINFFPVSSRLDSSLRFNSSWSSVTQFRYSSSRAATFPNPLAFFSRSTLRSSPTCFHRSTSDHTSERLSARLTRRSWSTTRTATFFKAVIRSLKLNRT